MIDAVGRPQSVLVLGGSSEIAQAIVARLVPARCRTVVLAGREGPRLSEAADEARAAGAETVAEPWPSTRPTPPATGPSPTASSTGSATSTWSSWPPACSATRTVDEQDPAAAAAVITTNFTGLASALLAVADRLRHQGHGRLVVLSSVAGERARRANFIYGVVQGRARRLLPGAGGRAGRDRGWASPSCARASWSGG